MSRYSSALQGRSPLNASARWPAAIRPRDLFVTRAIQQYLAADGRFAFVVPNAVLDRPCFAGFRAGRYHAPSESVEVVFTGSWDLRRLRPHFFPRGCAVLFGRRTRLGTAGPLPTLTEQWTGKIPRGAQSQLDDDPHLTREPATLTLVGESLVESPYGPRFANGATIFPRMLFVVEQLASGPLGTAGGTTRVRSERSTADKPLWKNLPGVEGVVENEFLAPSSRQRRSASLAAVDKLDDLVTAMLGC